MRSNRWFVLGVLVFARTAMGYQFQAVGSLSGILIDDLAIDLAAIGALIGLFMLPGLVVAVPGGFLARRIGDKRLALFGLAAMVAGGLITAAGADLNTAIAGRVVSGAGAVLLNIVLTKMVADWFSDKDLVFAMALLVTSWPLGIGLGLVTQGAIGAAFGWPVAVFVTSLICGAALLLMWPMSSRAPGAAAPGAAAPKRGGLSRGEIYRVSLAGLIWMLFNVGYIVVVSFTPVFLTENGASVAVSGLLTSVATWTLIVSIPLGGLIAERLKRDTLVMLIGFAAMAAAMIVLPFVSILAMVIVVGIAAGPPAGAIMAAATRVLRPENRSAGMGIFITWYYLGMTALPFVAGAVRDLSGNAAGPLVFGGVLLIVCVVVLLVFAASNGRAAETS
jgi:predicted MFS family arabinose efflux permease